MRLTADPLVNEKRTSIAVLTWLVVLVMSMSGILAGVFAIADSAREAGWVALSVGVSVAPFALLLAAMKFPDVMFWVGQRHHVWGRFGRWAARVLFPMRWAIRACRVSVGRLWAESSLGLIEPWLASGVLSRRQRRRLVRQLLDLTEREGDSYLVRLTLAGMAIDPELAGTREASTVARFLLFSGLEGSRRDWAQEYADDVPERVFMALDDDCKSHVILMKVTA